ncbi:MAG: hypothetical protein IPJ52_00900 [Rhodocyclaceae bacterium]|nr:hypothetical protein [Rhodocyclaceae bacterium]
MVLKISDTTDYLQLPNFRKPTATTAAIDEIRFRRMARSGAVPTSWHGCRRRPSKRTACMARTPSITLMRWAATIPSMVDRATTC